MTNSPPPAAIKIPLSVLTNDLIEEIKTRLLFIGDPLPPSELVVPSRDAILDSIYDETEDIDFLNYLEQKFSCTSTANPITMKISNFGQAPTVSGVGKGWIVTPGWIRERAAEVFFEKGNEDEINLPEIVLSSLLSVRYNTLESQQKTTLSTDILIF